MLKPLYSLYIYDMQLNMLNTLSYTCTPHVPITSFYLDLRNAAFHCNYSVVTSSFK